MVVTEWEVVTTTNTEVIVTETGSSPQHKQHASVEPQITGRDSTGHASQTEIVGLALNVTGHRRSKSSDDGTRAVDGITVDSSLMATSPEKPQEAASSVHAKQSLDGTGSELQAAEWRVSTVATYTLSEPSAVDRFRSIAETQLEDRWTTGLITDQVFDYVVVDFVENIRLGPTGNDLDSDNPDDPEYQQKENRNDPNSATKRSECPSVDVTSNEYCLRQEVIPESSQAPHQVECQSATACNGDQQNGCLSTAGKEDNKVAEAGETAKFGDRVTNLATAKEDVDDEEKEADEAENGEIESEETTEEEKGTLELSCHAAEKNDCGQEASPPNVEKPLNSTEVQSDAQEQRVVELTNEICASGVATNEDRSSVPDAAQSSNVSVTATAGELEDQLYQTTGQLDDRDDIHSHLDDITEIRCSQSGATDSNARPSTVSKSQSAETESLRSKAAMNFVTSGRTNVDGAIENGSSRTDERCSGTNLAAAETDASDGAGATSALNNDEERVRNDTVSMQLNNAEPGPAAMSNEHTQYSDGSQAEDTIQSSVNGAADAQNRNKCVSTATDTSYDNNCVSEADSRVRSPTVAHDQVGRPATAQLRRRKDLVDVESQTDAIFGGDQPETPGVVSDSTQSSISTETLAQHPFSSCTAVNCLVCATIGQKNDIIILLFQTK